MILPTACGDDDDPGGTAGAGGKDGGSDARGGSGGTGGAKDSGPDRVDAPADRVDAGGAAGTGGKGGMAGTGGKAGASGAAGKGGMAGTGGTGGTPEAGPDTPDAPPDISIPPDAGPDGDGGPTCPNPSNATRARACLVLTPEQITFADAGPLLDGQGTLFIHVFGTALPGDTTAPLAQVVYPPPNADGGLNQTSVNALPPVIEIDNLPTDIDAGTLYIRTLFVDNPLWLQTQKGLTYGMFVGGYNLNNGVQPPPPLRPVQLTTGMGTMVPQRLTALRRFTSAVVLGLPDGGAPAGDGQGPMSLGAFIQASPANQFVFGGLQVPCVDVTKGPIPVAGFFYSATAGDLNFWIGGQVDDFGVGGSSPAGSLVSLTSLGEIPTPQRITITADQYSASIPQITLTGVRPPPDGGVDNVSCPVPDAGSDAGPDVGVDVGSDDGDDGASTDASDDGG
jgi:hypothetical protein